MRSSYVSLFCRRLWIGTYEIGLKFNGSTKLVCSLLSNFLIVSNYENNEL